MLRRIPVSAILVAASLSAVLPSACSTERARVAAAPQGGRVALGRPFQAGTVGAAINGYWVDMDGVRKWYAAIAAISAHALTDSLYHTSLQMQLDSSLSGYLSALDRDTVVQRAIRAQDLSNRDFAVLTGAITIGRFAPKIVDSIAPGTSPTNVGPELIAFFNTHRAEIDSLEAQVPRSR